MIKKSELIRLFYKNNIDYFFKCDNIDNVFKDDSNNENKLELNFGQKKHGIDKTYKKITSLIFNVGDKDKVSIYYRDAWKYSDDFLSLFQVIFGKNNIVIKRSELIVYTFGDYEAFFSNLNKFFSLVEPLSDFLLNTSKPFDGKNQGQVYLINAVKNNYTISELVLTKNKTWALSLSRENENTDLDFIREINKIRTLSSVARQSGDAIEFNETIGAKDVLNLLSTLEWKVDELVEDKQKDIEQTEKEDETNDINLKENPLDYFANWLMEQLNCRFGDEYKKEIIGTIIWKWTERNGKYRGCNIWSKKARSLFNEFGGNMSKIDGLLTHEHIVPKNVVINNLLNCDRTLNSIKTILSKSKAAVILKEEDKILNENGHRNNMPEHLRNKDILDFTKVDEFARYTNTGIELIDVTTNKKIL